MNDEFFSIQNSLKPAKGRVLLSEPLMDDFYFKQAIILLAEHSDEGSVGFVINHPVDISFEKLMPDFPKANYKISIGGPVNTDSLQFIHTRKDLFPESVEILPGVFWGGDFILLKDYLETKLMQSDEVFFFLGYSGWSSGQLSSEIRENSWLIAETTLDEIMEVNQKSWATKLEGMGEKYRIWANFPDFPSLN